MVKKRAYTSPKHRPDKPECAGSTPARGTKIVDNIILVIYNIYIARD
jgi:hypothetical protein